MAILMLKPGTVVSAAATRNSPAAIVLTRDVTVLGRQRQVGIVHVDSAFRNMVSRQHCTVRRSKVNDTFSYVLVDGASLNGTAVNNRRILEQRLHDCDVITLGGCSTTAIGDTHPGALVSDLHYVFREHDVDNVLQPLIDAGATVVDSAGQPWGVAAAASVDASTGGGAVVEGNTLPSDVGATTHAAATGDPPTLTSTSAGAGAVHTPRAPVAAVAAPPPAAVVALSTPPSPGRPSGQGPSALRDFMSTLRASSVRISQVNSDALRLRGDRNNAPIMVDLTAQPDEAIVTDTAPTPTPMPAPTPTPASGSTARAATVDSAIGTRAAAGPGAGRSASSSAGVSATRQVLNMINLVDDDDDDDDVIMKPPGSALPAARPAPAASAAPTASTLAGGGGPSAADSQFAEAVGDETQCVICQDYLCLAHSVECGHTFCKQCIFDWLRCTSARARASAVGEGQPHPGPRPAAARSSCGARAWGGVGWAWSRHSQARQPADVPNVPLRDQAAAASGLCPR